MDTKTEKIKDPEIDNDFRRKPPNEDGKDTSPQKNIQEDNIDIDNSNINIDKKNEDDKKSNQNSGGGAGSMTIYVQKKITDDNDNKSKGEDEETINTQMEKIGKGDVKLNINDSGCQNVHRCVPSVDASSEDAFMRKINQKHIY